MKIQIKIKAKAKSFCQTIKTIKNGNKKNFVETGESRLIPLRDSCNGCAQMCLYGFRYFHRDHNVVKRRCARKQFRFYFLEKILAISFYVKQDAAIAVKIQKM
jgi:hypothetical protein